MEIFIEGIGLLGPGLESWVAGRSILAGGTAYESNPVILPASPLLAANERRRTVATVKLALRIGAEAFENARRDPRQTATVFTSSGGDGETIHAILEALAVAEREVSPTRFHNSVHNAPSGYWTIATQTHEPTTSLCAHDESFSAGLLDAAAQASVDRRAVALIAYDLPYPEPLNTYRPIASTFGVAFVISPTPTAAAFIRLAIERASGPVTPTAMDNRELENLRQNNPAARSLPLLVAMAGDTPRRIVLDGAFGNAIAVTVTPL
jgi:hypothetical protein